MRRPTTICLQQLFSACILSGLQSRCTRDRPPHGHGPTHLDAPNDGTRSKQVRVTGISASKEFAYATYSASSYVV
jgi:hypothetical protein